MHCSHEYKGLEAELEALFRRTFSASEGAEEGAVIASLVQDIFERTPDSDLLAVIASENNTPQGAILWTRLSFPEDARAVFLMSPVAVAPQVQHRGIGQNLIKAGLDRLRNLGVSAVLSYGDPVYYAKTGFAQISTHDAQPPMPLSHPEGWIGQSLTEDTFSPLAGPSHCVSAFDRPEIW